MALRKMVAAVAFVGAVAIASQPAYAQAVRRGGGGHDGGGQRGGGGGARVEGRAPQRVPQGGRVYSGGSGPRGSWNGPRVGPAPRVYSAPRAYSAPRYYNNGPRYYNAPRAYVGPRGYVAPRVPPRVYAPSYRSYGYRSYGYTPYYRSYGYRSYGYRPYYGYGYGYRPYIYRPYAFRPRFSIGFGFFVGYPVPYTYAYPAYYPVPVPYPVPYPVPSYGYPANGYGYNGYDPGTVSVRPGPSYSGGVSFEVTPAEATIYVDGRYVGPVSNFDGTQQPLTLPIGSHRIELRCDGYETVTFDVNVLAGQVIPYRGDMQPASY